MHGLMGMILGAFCLVAQVHGAENVFDLEGRFHYDSVEGTAFVERVNLDMRERGAQGELRRYRSKGYHCSKKLRTLWQCQMVLAASEAPAELQERLENEFRGMTVEIGPARAQDEMTHESESFRDYLVRRDIAFDGQRASEFTYRVMRAGGRKIESPVVGLEVRGLGDLTLFREATKTDGRRILGLWARVIFIKR